MAFGQLVSKISGLFSAKPSGNAEVTEQHLLALTKKCLERAQRLMTSPTASAKKFNFEQCMYLVDKLKMAAESADLLVERGFLSFPSQGDSANCLEVFKLLYALATEVEYFTQICSKDAWIQAALTLSNVSEHISSIGFNLMLWSVHSSEINQLRERRILTSAEVDGIFKAEVEVVEAKASVDRDTMLRELHDVLSKLKSSSSEYQLAVLLLGRLDESWKVQGGDSAGSSQASLSEPISRSLQRMETLGKGCAGTVYRAKWLGAEVAQKTFYGQNFPDFEKEVAILAGLSHPNVASLLYCDKDRWECSIVMELMDTDLFGLIQKRLRSNNTQEFPFDLLEAVDIMHQVGKGMRYLHEMKIVHRDLKSMNILVKCRRGTSELEIAYVLAKVADFGMSKTKETSVTCSNQTLNVGTSRWMAPETFKVCNSASQAEMSDGEAMVMNYPFKSDVYSFGMVCYEILSGETPFSTTYNLRDVKKMVLDGVRPPLPYECPSLLKRLIERCWSDDPSKRPSFEEICKELRYLKYLYPKSVIEVLAKLVKMFNASPAACQPQVGTRILKCLLELRGEIDAFDIEKTGVVGALMEFLEVENQDCQQDAVRALYILAPHVSIQTSQLPCQTVLNYLRSTRPNVREAAVGLLELMVAKKAVDAKMFMETPEALKCTLLILKKSNLFPEGHEGPEMKPSQSSASALLKLATEDGDDSVRLGILNDGLDILLKYVQRSGNDEFKELLTTMLSLICTTGNGPNLEAVTEDGGHIFLLMSLRENISKEAAARGLLSLLRGNAKSRAHVLKADFVTVAVNSVEQKFASPSIALALAETFPTSDEMDQIYASGKGVLALLILLEHCPGVEGKGAAAAVIAKIYPRLRGSARLEVDWSLACHLLVKYLEEEDKSQLKMFLRALAAFATGWLGRQMIHEEHGVSALIKCLKNKELKVEVQGLMLKILTGMSSHFLNRVMELRGEIDAFDIEKTGVVVALMEFLEVENQDCQQDAVRALYILAPHVSIQTSQLPCQTVLNYLRSTRPNVREAAVGLLELMVAKKAVDAKMFMETPEALKCTLLMLKKSNLLPKSHKGPEMKPSQSSASALLKLATEDGDDSVRLGILNDGLDILLKYVQRSGNDEFKELLTTMLSLICTTGNGPNLEAVTEDGGHIFLLMSLRENISKEAAARGLLSLLRGNAKSRAHVLKADFVTVAVNSVEQKFASPSIALALAETFPTSDEMDQILISKEGFRALFVLLEHCPEVKGKGAAAAVIAKIYPRLRRWARLEVDWSLACHLLVKYLEEEDKSQLKMFLRALAAFATGWLGRQMIHEEHGVSALIKCLKNKELKVEVQGLLFKILTGMSSHFLNRVMELRGEIDAFDIEKTGVVVALMEFLEVENQDCQQDAVRALYILAPHVSIQTSQLPCQTVLNYLRSTRPNVREAAVGLLELMVAKKAVDAKMFMETPEALKCTLLILKKSNLFPEGHEGPEMKPSQSSASALLKLATEDGDDSVRLGILNDGLDILLKYVQRSGNDEFKELLTTMLSLICTTGNGPNLEAVTEGGGHIFLLMSLRENISKEAAARGLLSLLRGNAKSRAHVLKADFVTVAVNSVEQKFASPSIALALAETFPTSDEMDQIYASGKGVLALLILLEHCPGVEGKGAAAAVIAKIYPRLRGSARLEVDWSLACHLLVKYLEEEDKSQLKMFLRALAAFATGWLGRQMIHEEHGVSALIKCLKNKELKVEVQGLMLKILTDMSIPFTEEGVRRDPAYHKICNTLLEQKVSQLLFILPESEEFIQHAENMKNLLVLIRNFSMAGKAAVTQLLDHNAVDVLLKVLKQHERVDPVSVLTEHAVKALDKFMDKPSGKQAFIRGNGIQSLVAVLRLDAPRGSDVKRFATIILTSVAKDPDTRRLACDTIFSCYRDVLCLLNKIMDEGETGRVKWQAAVLMKCLAMYGPTSKVCSAMLNSGSLEALKHLKEVQHCREVADAVFRFVREKSKECKRVIDSWPK